MFLKKNLDTVLSSQQEMADANGSNDSYKKIGKTLGWAEKWMSKQIALLDEFPKRANGLLDTRNLSREDILRYNNLI